MSIMELISGRKRVLLSENERLLALYEGRVLGIYGPGAHMLPNRKGSLVVERYSLDNPVFRSTYEKPLFARLPDIAKRHLTIFATGPDEVLVIEREEGVEAVLEPDRRVVLWADAGPWKTTRFALSEGLALPGDLARRLMSTRKTAMIEAVIVPEGQVGLLLVDGVFRERLAPGFHAFWKAKASVQVKLVDMRRQVLDVNGQELLTRDRVTIRINATAEYRIADPEKAALGAQDAGGTLYRAVQLAFREALGRETLDRLLETKAGPDAAALERLRAELAEAGLEIGAVALKDVILPGEMREILNQVVAAEKQAEANVIRRREETNATRSLLNTAKVMAENPVMLRLKELEALESIASKVERLTIHNGVDGLMNDIVTLR